MSCAAAGSTRAEQATNNPSRETILTGCAIRPENVPEDTEGDVRPGHGRLGFIPANEADPARKLAEDASDICRGQGHHAKCAPP